MTDKDILPQLPECDFSTEEDTSEDVHANATPDTKSVEMLMSSVSSVSTTRSSDNSGASSEGEEGSNNENVDDELLDLLVETLDGDFDHDLLL
jgi:hypothetical protein